MRVAMATTNEQYLDALIRHQIFTLRVSGRTKNEIVEILNRTERRMARVIRERKSYKAETAVVLFAILAEIRNKAWDKAEEVWLTNFIELALPEPRFQQAALLGVSSKAFIKGLPTVKALRSHFCWKCIPPSFSPPQSCGPTATTNALLEYSPLRAIRLMPFTTNCPS